jgi:tetratricopeptide (TPR) repeat protein
MTISRFLTTATVWTFIAALASGAGAQVRVPRDPDIVEYLELVASYRAGRDEAAVAALRGWDKARLERTVRALPGSLAPVLRVCPELPEHVAFATIDAAVLLHTDAAIVALNRERPVEGGIHLDQAQKLLNWTLRFTAEIESVSGGGRRVASPADERALCGAPRPITERDWLLAVSLLTLRAWTLPAAEHFVTRLADIAPDDTNAQFATGAVHEALALNLTQYNLPPPLWRLTGSHYNLAQEGYARGQRDVQKYREQSARAYARALSLEPARQDIRLRLGRVLYQRGRGAEAQRELEQVAASATATDDRYLAALFLGRIAEDADRLDEAVRWYERAIALNASSHVARKALAHALDHKGLVVRAREALRLALTVPEGPTADPWTAYPHGPWQIGYDLLSSLRTQVQRR